MEGILFPRGVVAGQEGLEEYRARGGYEALVRAVKTTPEGIIKEVSDAALRGRGGAGFPTGKKWSFTRERPEQPRYLVLNGGEDEPGSKKDRLLMENLPHLVIEGVIIAAYAIGANKAYLYVNANYETAIKSTTDALAEAKAAGYWGKGILGDSFNLDIELIPAPHNYVAGEDTAVLEVIEGKKAWPRQKPPFPVTVGLFGKPTAFFPSMTTSIDRESTSFLSARRSGTSSKSAAVALKATKKSKPSCRRRHHRLIYRRIRSTHRWITIPCEKRVRAWAVASSTWWVKGLASSRMF